jgi:hypothetical protein
MEQRANRFVFAPSIVEHDRGHTHEMSNVGCSSPFSGLLPMDLVRVSDGFVESSSESDHVAGRIGSLAGCPEAGKSLIGEPEP